MQKRFFKIFWILFYFLVFFLLLRNSFRYLDPDLGWHLKVGEDILKKNSVPHINNYNYTLGGQQWVDHEWLLDAIVFWIYNNFGYIVLSVVFVVLLLSALGVWHYFIKKKYLKNKHYLLPEAIFLLWGTIAIFPHVGVRMQEVTLLNLVLLLIIIFYYNKNKNYKPLLFLPPLFYLWASLHGGFLIGGFILGLFIGVKIVEGLLSRKTSWQFFDTGKILSGKHISVFILFSVLSFLVTLATPYGLELYSFLSGYTNTFYMTHIQEWLGQYYLPLNYWQFTYLSTGAAILCLWFFLVFHKKRGDVKLDLWQLSLFVIFLVLAFKSRRHFPLFFVVSLPVFLYVSIKFLNLKEFALHFKNRWWDATVKSYLAICFVVAMLSLAVSINFTHQPFQNYCEKFPCEAVDFLKNNPQYEEHRIFNKYGWGGYLLWTYPQKELFADGRLPQYEFAGHTLLEEYFEFFKEDKVKDKLEEYDIEMVLIKSKEAPLDLDWFEKYFVLAGQEVEKEKNHLREFLREDPEWKVVHENEVSAIFIKDR